MILSKIKKILSPVDKLDLSALYSTNNERETKNMNAPKYVGHFTKLDNTIRTINFSFAKDVNPDNMSLGPWQASRSRPQRDNIEVAETHALVLEYLPDGTNQYRHVNLSNGVFFKVDNG
jgi:hypothetical protein